MNTIHVYQEIDGIKAEVSNGLFSHLQERIIALAPYSSTELSMNDGLYVC